MSGVLVELFRFIDPRLNAAKEWAIRHDAEGVQIYFGRIGTRLQQRVIPLTKCNGSPVNEANRRITAQLRQGYVARGTHRLAADRKTLTPVETGTPGEPARASPPPPPAQDWCWERRAPPGESLIESVALYDHATAIASVLKRGHLIGEWWSQWQGEHRDSAWLMHLEPGDTPWSFGFSAAAGQAGVPHLLDTAGEGQGVIDAEAPGAVRLFLLALAKRDPHLVVVDATSHIITSVPEGLAVEPEVLVLLGLQPRSIQSLLGGAETASWF